MLREITQSIEFDAGHRLIGHESKCKYLHGHRYRAEITVGAGDLDTVGRVIDFGELKRVAASWINAHWDHNIILHNDDPLLHVGLTDEEQACNTTHLCGGRQPFVMPNGNPTAENMVEVLAEALVRELVDEPLKVLRVRLYETPNCWADYCYTG